MSGELSEKNNAPSAGLGPQEWLDAIPQPALLIEGGVAVIANDSALNLLGDPIGKQPSEWNPAFDATDYGANSGKGLENKTTIDGKEFIRIVRRRYKGNLPPIIALSDVLVEQFDSIEKIGADFLIAKGPIESMRKEIGSLLEAIQDKSFPSNMSDAITDTSKFFPRQVTLELMESLNFQKAVTESLGIGVIVVDKDAKIINSNPAACRLLGLISEDLTNRPVTSLFEVDDKKSVVRALKEVLRDKENAGRVFETTLKSARVRVTVTMLMVAGEISGWTIALEELDKWVEQA